MSDTRVGIESRRSARVPLKVVILAQGLTEPITCEGEIIVVNRHGALISTSVSLRVGMKIEIHVILTRNVLPLRLFMSILIGLGWAESGL
jgi:hypothetical protein